jgi:hypothetical protein
VSGFLNQVEGGLLGGGSEPAIQFCEFFQGLMEVVHISIHQKEEEEETSGLPPYPKVKGG